MTLNEGIARFANSLFKTEYDRVISAARAAAMATLEGSAAPAPAAEAPKSAKRPRPRRIDWRLLIRSMPDMFTTKDLVAKAPRRRNTAALAQVAVHLAHRDGRLVKLGRGQWAKAEAVSS